MGHQREEMRALWRLAVPIVLTNLGTMLMGTVDVIMVGSLEDAQALAAASIGDVWIHATTMFAMGLVFGIDPIVTQAHGARDHARAARALRSGVVVALLTGLVTGVLWTFSEDVLVAFEQDPATARLAHRYTQVQIWSVPLFLWFVALRQHLQGRGILAPALWVIGVANVFNALANWVLIHGKLGFPALGLEGAGIASGLTRAFMLLGLGALVLGFRLGVPRAEPPDSQRPRGLDGAGLREVLRYGLPTAVQLSLEIWAFGYANLMAGRLGDVPVAAHTIALKMASLTFMVPLGISAAAVTRVGNLVGEGRLERAQRAAWVSIAMGAGAMGLAGVALLLGRGVLPLAFTRVPEVVAACSAVLPIAAAFQVFDGTQVVGGGVLRGMGETRPAAVFNLLGYWVLGLPLASWMAFEGGLGLRGVWWGLAIGLAIVALCLLVWVHRRGPARMRPAPARSGQSTA